MSSSEQKNDHINSNNVALNNLGVGNQDNNAGTINDSSVAKHATLIIGNKQINLPVINPTVGNNALDIRKLGEVGYWAYDPAFLVTASCDSKITYIDGDKGLLMYRGYAIEDLAINSNFLETSYLLLNDKLPSKDELNEFARLISGHMTLPDQIINLFKGFNRNAHPMSILMSLVSGLSAYYPVDESDLKNDNTREFLILNLIAKMPVLVAMCYRYTNDKQFLLARHELDYVTNFIYMMFANPVAKFEINPIISKALDVILLLHADHEQNASTSTVRLSGSSGTHPYAAVAAGIGCLWGAAHGGANEAVLKMLNKIHQENISIDDFIRDVKNKKFRLMGFGHRVYKNLDPRASVIREQCYKVLNALNKRDDPLFDLALNLEKVALSDQYFIDKKLYPNVDFYSGIILQAIGIPANMFTTIFALARVVGWLAQWQEMFTDPKLKIGRPRQVYIGRNNCTYESSL